MVEYLRSSSQSTKAWEYYTISPCLCVLKKEGFLYGKISKQFNDKASWKSIARVRQEVQTDLTAYGGNFTQICPSLIWKRVNSHLEFSQRLLSYKNRRENKIEKIKELTGEKTLKVETSCGLFHIVTLHLAGGIWYLHRCPEGSGIRPLWRYGNVYESKLGANEVAEFILEFDKWIPHILDRAEAAVLQRKEQITTCEILKTSALGIIKQLVADGAINPPGKMDVRCTRPESIEIHVEKKPIWTIAQPMEFVPKSKPETFSMSNRFSVNLGKSI